MPLTPEGFTARVDALKKEIARIEDQAAATAIALHGFLEYGTGATNVRAATTLNPVLFGLGYGIDTLVDTWAKRAVAQAMDRTVRALDLEMQTDQVWQQGSGANSGKSWVVAGTLPIGTEVRAVDLYGAGGMREVRYLADGHVKSIVPIWEMLRFPSQPWTYRTKADWEAQIALGVPTTAYQWEQIKKERLYGTARERAADKPVLRQALNDPNIILLRQRMGLPT